MAEIRSFKDLIVWQKAMELVTGIYMETGAFPSDEKFGLVSQMRRCAVSIPSNIAEGYGRRSTNDYIRFLQIAIGSVYELQTQLEICRNLHFLESGNFEKLDADLAEIERMLASLARKVRNGKKW
ncbi:four helix bundle protein [Candidatus Sumerlaeota bacterium]|nr:four helix bundle protein [Candidatus Sumerlaeota bacterium]